MAEPTGKTSFVTRGLRLSPFGGRRPRPPSQITAIDIDGPTLRVVQATGKGSQTEIARVATARLELSPEADRSDATQMGKAVARALASIQLRPSSVVMGVPRAQVILRTLQLPVIPDVRELASMVHFQIGRDLPFRMEDAVVDFKVRRQIRVPAARPEASVPAGPSTGDKPAESAPTAKLEVLVAVLKREVVEYYFQVAEIAGLKLVALGLLAYANARCVDACRVADGAEAFALVSLRPDEVSIDVIAEQSLLFSRGASLRLFADAPASPTPDAQSLVRTDPIVDSSAEVTKGDGSGFSDAVTIEVVRSLHGFSGMEADNPVGKVVVTGATGFEEAVVTALARRLNRPCALLEPGTVLTLPPGGREHWTGCIAAIGLALGLGDPKGLPFDFLNPKRPAVAKDLGRIRILAGLAAAAAIFVFILSLRTFLLNQRTQTYQKAAQELSEAEKNRPLYKRMIQQSAVVEDWAKAEPNWLEHYAYLSAVLPPSEDLYITSFTVSGQGVIHMAVQARSGEVLAKLDKQLRGAGYDVKPLAITPGADRHGYEFRSTVDLSVTEKLRIDLGKIKAPARPSDDGSLDPVLRKGGQG
ncbi:MAG: pilus assembly protein PilM [Verrucomicrobia bacterium]|nr:pilus assembly protein PilM [Verrucomicrobiota bacterium]